MWQLKVLLASGNDETFLIRFEREAKALAHLSHPNIVKVLDYGEENGSPYLVMEYVSGGTLKDRMGAPLPWQEAAKLLLPITHALQYAHSQNIIHRDVKPANILISDSGHPMLSDFGIAKMLGQQTTTDLTGTGFGIGTPHYMSPEQSFGKPLDGRADIYALGILFYELVTGKLPFDADTPMAVVLKHATEIPPLPSEILPGLPEQVENIILRSIAKVPEDRFPTMAAMGVALENLSRGILPPMAVLTQIPTRQSVIPATQMVQPDKPVETMQKRTQSHKVLRWLVTFFGTLIGVLLLASILLSIGGAVLISRLIQTAFSKLDYTFVDTNIKRSEFLTEEEATDALSGTLDMYAADLAASFDVNFQSPDRAFLSAETKYGPAKLEVKITEKKGKPIFSLRKYNDFPLLLVGGILSKGINDGFSIAMDNAEFELNHLEISNTQIEYEIIPLE